MAFFRRIRHTRFPSHVFQNTAILLSTRHIRFPSHACKNAAIVPEHPTHPTSDLITGWKGLFQKHLTAPITNVEINLVRTQRHRRRWKCPPKETAIGEWKINDIQEYVYMREHIYIERGRTRNGICFHISRLPKRSTDTKLQQSNDITNRLVSIRKYPISLSGDKNIQGGSLCKENIIYIE